MSGMMEVSVDQALENPEEFFRMYRSRARANGDDNPKLRLHRVMYPGNKVYIRTVTFHHYGEVDEFTGDTVTLKDPYYVRNTEGWEESLRKGQVEASAWPHEKIPTVTIQTASIVDSFNWPHPITKVGKGQPNTTEE